MAEQAQQEPKVDFAPPADPAPAAVRPSPNLTRDGIAAEVAAGMFDAHGRGWFIDLDQSRLRIPATGWREANLQRLRRSLHKQRGARSAEAIEAEFARLRAAYAVAWDRGY